MSESDHYKSVSSHYNSHCFYKDKGFNDFICDSVKNLIPNNSKILCDVGSGTGSFADMLLNNLHKDLKCHIYCVEPNRTMLLQTPKCKYLHLIENSAENFFEGSGEEGGGEEDNKMQVAQKNGFNSSNLLFDTIYFKESIHHIIDTSKLLKLFENCFYKLNENGKILIITRPHSLPHNYPFSNVMRYYWQQMVPNPQIYRILLSKVFGTSNCQIIETQYPFKVLANEWISMMNHRFWSMLSKLSENEINDAIAEIMRKHSINDVNKDYFEFDDTITFIVAKKTTDVPASTYNIGVGAAASITSKL